MQLGSLELQIFVALFLVLGSAFVALVCDFLKGNNEQLRERNIELRVRQDERERMGLFQPLAHPIAWLQSLAEMIRNPGSTQSAPATATASPVAGAAATARSGGENGPDLENLTGAAVAEDVSEEDRNPQRRHRYDEFKAAAKHQSWATKEELEQLAGRAARIRSRHEASHRRIEEPVVAPKAPLTPAAAAVVEPVEVAARRPKVTELPKLEQQPRPAVVPHTAAPVIAVEEEQTLVYSKTLVPPKPAELPSEIAAALAPVTETASVDAAAAAVQQPEVVAVQPEPVVIAVAQGESAPPPMSQTPVATEWAFPYSKAKPREQSSPPVPADLTPIVVRPGASAISSSLPSIFPDAGLTDTSKVVEASSLSESESESEKDSAPIETGSAVPAAPAVAELNPVAIVLPTSQAIRLPGVVAAIGTSEPIAVAQTRLAEVAEVTKPVEPLPAVRTRIQPVEVTPVGELDTAEIQAPAALTAAPSIVVDHVSTMTPAERRPAEASQPVMDVVALQKATGESKSAIHSRGNSGAEGLTEAKLEIPPGLHEPGVLGLLLENQTPYSGVVVAIGLNDYDTLRDKLTSGADSVAALNKMVLSMLRPQDFACRFQDDEYILIYPGERGSSAQRRLFQVSEKLWDFQLRSLGNLSVMFSWGGLEVTNETLAEAVASARERMYQTKRNRKPSGLEFAATRKKVVNG